MSKMIRQAEVFARKKHEGQFRKGVLAEPYITHVADVARLTAEFGGNEAAICAAWLHDTVEDCPPTSFKDIEQEFTIEIAAIVREMTDDKSLPKAERKRMQIVNAPAKSRSASIVKLADKSSNVRSIATSPAADWNFERRMAYLQWASTVVAALPYKPEIAVSEFLDACAAATRAIADEFPHGAKDN